MTALRLLFFLATIDIAACTVLAQSEPWPTGWATVIGPTIICPAGHTCTKINIQCPQIVDKEATVAVGQTQGRIRGVLAMFTPAGEAEYYSDLGPEVAAWIDSLRLSGIVTVQVSYKGKWARGTGGLASGAARLACRPATVIKYIHDTVYAPLGFSGKGRFVATGNSAGASQVGYSLAFYGADRFIAAAIMSGGPPHAALHKSCMNNTAERLYWFNRSKRAAVDKSYAIYVAGPCANPPRTDWIPTWQANSIAYGGNRYVYPRTDIRFIVGKDDPKMIQTAGDYYQRITQQQDQSLLSWTVLPGVGHDVFATMAGRAALEAAIRYHLR